jgi:hypothetical protein
MTYGARATSSDLLSRCECGETLFSLMGTCTEYVDQEMWLSKRPLSTVISPSPTRIYQTPISVKSPRSRGRCEMRPLTYVPLALPLLPSWPLALRELITKPTKNTLVVPFSLSMSSPWIGPADQTRPHYRAVPSEMNVYIQSHHIPRANCPFCYHPVSLGFDSWDCRFFSLMSWSPPTSVLGPPFPMGMCGIDRVIPPQIATITYWSPIDWDG